MTPKDVTEQMEQHRALNTLWNYLLPGRSIDPYQFYIWMRLHPFSRVVDAIEKTGRKSVKLGGKMTADHLVRFCSKVANDSKAATLRAAA
jgi:hypothetical protein